MFQQPAIQRNPKRQQMAVTASVPAPVGGWNDRDSIAAMDPKDAVILDNFFPLPSKVIIRKGNIQWVGGLPDQVETLMAYNPQSGTPALFGASLTSFYNVTNTGAVGAAVLTGLTNARWQYINMATGGGSFLMAVNGSDKLRGWDGAAWWTDGDGAHDITGVDTSLCISICVFKRRVWLIKKNSASAWYLGVDSIAGAATELAFGSIFSEGGTLMAMANWSLDAGIGIDDYCAFISNQGEVALYKGSDPTSATTWALVGVFSIGAPIGRRCTAQYGGDVAVICEDGLVPLSRALMTARMTTAIALSDKIQNSISAATTLYGSSFGWQVLVFPGQNMCILNVPVSVGRQHQYVMNTISGAWCRWTGWDANCFEVFNGELYFGGNTVVHKAWSGHADYTGYVVGTNINAEALQAFNYFGKRSMLKQWTMVRPVVALDNTAGLLYGLNVDYDRTPPAGVPTFTSSAAATWDSGLWDAALWGGDPQIQKGWQSVGAVGYCAALHIKAATNTAQIEWSSTDYAYKPAGVL